MADVFIDYKFVGTVKDAKAFSQRLISERRMNNLPLNVNVFFDEQTGNVFVEIAKGRSVRPLVVVKDGRSLFTKKHKEQLTNDEIAWSDLVKQGIIEYLDSAEEENAYVAFFEEDLTPQHTHIEVSPVDIIGVATGLVPFGHHDSGPKLSTGSKNQKQGIGFYAANFPMRMDMDTNLLNYPQVPIVSTVIEELSQYSKHPSGQNVIVAVMSFQGFNMEDAIILNQGSVDRGMARSHYYRPVITEELRYSGGLLDDIGVPSKDIKGYRSEKDYRYLESDGIIYPEAKVGENDVVIGKSSPPRFLNAMDEYNLSANSRRESSMAMGHGQTGIIDGVFLTENAEGNKLIQVRLRDPRIPEMGDKFTSRHSQKGVISLLVPELDMPFTMTGVKPDVIFSPHGIPTRMTIGHVLELLGGKVGTLGGRYVDGTIFKSEKEQDLRHELVKYGFKENGTETMYNGTTGQRYQVQIFIGPMYYLRLKHQVRNKIHSRARGPIQLLTRQPTEGRLKEGGLRLGEMEKDTFIAHGASLLLKERFDSDRTILPISEDAGIIAVHDTRRGKYYCPVSGENAQISNIELSYAFKLILDEFKSLCLYPKLELKTKY
ncbi:MAG: DNA-directed RNA polymerase subunit B [Candidatus Woesearchaeota archaeon]